MKKEGLCELHAIEILLQLPELHHLWDDEDDDDDNSKILRSHETILIVQTTTTIMERVTYVIGEDDWPIKSESPESPGVFTRREVGADSQELMCKGSMLDIPPCAGYLEVNLTNCA